LHFKYPAKMIGSVLLLLAFSGQVSAGAEKPETLDAYFKSYMWGGQIKPPARDSWLSADKGYHVIAGMMTTVFIGQSSLRGLELNRQESRYIGAGGGLVIGFTKEFYDSKKPGNRFSWKDLAADGVGILIGFLIMGIH